MYLAIELQSFGVYILATIYRNSESATNAGLKYFLLGGLSSCLILLGSGLIYSYTGITSFEGLYSLITVCASVTDGATGALEQGVLQGFQLGLILIFVGLLFKIAAAPFHNWAPDVYNDVPTIVTTWLTIMPKIALIMLLVEIVTSLGGTASAAGLTFIAGGDVKNLFLISSLFSLLIGTVLGLSQVKIKRLLAYSTISHVGFMLLALAINSEDSLESLLFYLIQYSITNLNAFLVLLSFGYLINSLRSRSARPASGDRRANYSSIASGETGGVNVSGAALGHTNTDISFITELRGQFYNYPLLTLSLAISLFSMAGIPPLVGFFAKQQVLYSALQGGYYFISIIAILVSVISASYYLAIIKVMHFDVNKAESSQGDAQVFLRREEPQGIKVITNTHAFLISLLTLSLVLFMLKPSILLNSTSLMALNIFIS
jgi:NADH-ubiquinone oxidoreductase chain 2